MIAKNETQSSTNAILLAVPELLSSLTDLEDINSKRVNVIFSNADETFLTALRESHKIISAIVLPSSVSEEILTKSLDILSETNHDQLLPFVIIGSITPFILIFFRGGRLFHSLSLEAAEEKLPQLLRSAAHEFNRVSSLMGDVAVSNSITGLIQSGLFEVKSLEEVNSLTSFLSIACPKPKSVALGLSELLINAVEHGNLAISFEEKTHLIETGTWKSTIDERLVDNQYKDRSVKVDFARSIDRITIIITDEGSGFDWEPFLEISAERLSHKHGRGIALAKETVFDSIAYTDKGNSVTATILL